MDHLVLPPADLIDALVTARTPVVCGHVNPDVDAMGAMLALARALPARRAAIALATHRTSKKVAFLRELAPEVAAADEHRVAGADLIVVLDTAGTNRVNLPVPWESIAARPIANIDHHITNSDFGRYNWVVPEASSTCEVVHHLIRAAGWPLDAATASLLYAGIYSDTAGFSLPNVTAATFEAAADLARCGADIERVGTRLCRNQHPHEFDLLRTVYHNTRLSADGRIAYSTLNHDEIARAGCTAEDIDEQVSIPRSLSDIKMAMLFSEAEAGVVRVNLRGEQGTPVLPIAQQMGGGGHLYSAGVRVRGVFAAVVDRVLRAASGHLDDLANSPGSPQSLPESQ